MKNNPIDRIKLLMSYDSKKTLNENINEILPNNEIEVDEQAAELKNILKTAGKDTKIAGKEFKNFGDEVVHSMGSKLGLNANEVKEVLAGEKVLQRNISDAITADFAKNYKIDKLNRVGPEVQKATKQLALSRVVEIGKREGKVLSKERITTIINDTEKEVASKVREFEEGVKKGKIANPNVDYLSKNKELRKQVKINQEGMAVLRDAQKSGEVVPEAKKIAKEAEDALKDNPKKWSLLNDIKDKLKKKYWYYLGILSVIGLGAAALRYLGFGEPSDDLFDNNCIDELIDDGSATVTYTTGGDPVVYVKNTGNEEYDKMGGLNFYNTGRVFSRDNTKRGYWKCSDTGSGSNTMEVIREEDLDEQLKTDPQLNNDVDTMIDLLDFPVSQDNLKDAYNLLKKYANNGKGKEFLQKYEDAGIGYGGVKTSLDYIYTKDPTAVDYKNAMFKVVSQMESGGEEVADLGGIIIKWDGDKSGYNTGGDGTTTTPKPDNQNKYVDCSNVDIATTPLQYGCKDNRIAEIQGCIGVATDGKFGPKTLKALVDGGYEASNGITKEMYDKVIANCKKGDTTGQMSDEDKARVDYLKTPIKLDLGPVPQMPNKNNINQPTDTVTKTLSPTNESPQDFYVRLESNGNFNSGKFGRDRARYKGKELNDEDLGKLDEFFRDSGYERRRPRITGKNYGEKYVWIKQ